MLSNFPPLSAFRILGPIVFRFQLSTLFSSLLVHLDLTLCSGRHVRWLYTFMALCRIFQSPRDPQFCTNLGLTISPTPSFADLGHFSSTANRRVDIGKETLGKVRKPYSPQSSSHYLCGVEVLINVETGSHTHLRTLDESISSATTMRLKNSPFEYAHRTMLRGSV